MRNPAKHVEIDSYGWSDLLLEKVQWENDGRDLLLVFSEPVAKSGKEVLRSVLFEWASNAAIDFSYPEGGGGKLLSTDAEISQNEQGVIFFSCSFGSRGSFRVTCNEVSVRRESPPSEC